MRVTGAVEILFLLVLAATSLATAQYVDYPDFGRFPRTNSSVDWQISSRGSALGGATVALPAFGDPFASNPAGLAGCRGIWAEYSRQPYFLTKNDDMRYRSWSVGIETGFGVFMASYRRLDYGSITLSTVSNPEGVGEMQCYDHTVGVAWGYSINSNFQVGLALKTYDEVHSLISGSIPPEVNRFFPETTMPYLIDFGAIFNTGNLFAERIDADNLSFGFSAQGFGSPARVSYSERYQVGNPPPTMITQPVSYVRPMPRNLKVGFSYQYQIAPGEGGLLRPLDLAVMGEYRDVLNSGIGTPGTYWGVGLELTILETAVLRAGGLAWPEESVYGHANKPYGRYGAGLRLPFARWFPTAPSITFETDFTVMPLLHDQDSAKMFTVGLRYEPGLR